MTTQIKELFNKLLASELLTEETRKELSTELDTVLEATIATKVEEAKKETEDKVRLELTEQFVTDKEALIEAVDTMVDVALKKELAQFHESIEQYKDLEVEYAEKLVEAKKEMAETVKADMTTLVERVDAFLEERLLVEFTELRETIEETRKLEFGRKVFEAFQAEYSTNYVEKDETHTALAEAKTQLEESKKLVESMSKDLNVVKREQKLFAVLESLQGRPREVMEAILKNTPTEKLDEQYNKFIGRVLHESVKVEEADTTEKEHADASVLAEGKDNSKVVEATRVVTGDSPVVESDTGVEAPQPVLNESAKNRLRQLAGLIE